MPFGPYDDFEACVRDNQDKDDAESYCGAVKERVEGSSALSESEQKALEESDCEDGFVSINGECVPVEEVSDVPPSALENGAVVFQLAGSLDTDPIERKENGDTVRYTDISWLSEGVWTDAASGTPTLYPADAFENLELEYDEQRFDGPPVNEMHDRDTESGEVNETSVAGYIDPDSLHVEGKRLRGDLVIELDRPAGEVADERMQDALSSEGRKGYGGPSVEIDPSGELVMSEHPMAKHEITGGVLEGAGLVKRQADDNIGFENEVPERGVALAEGGEGDKALYLQESGMPNMDAISDALESNGIDVSGMDDEEMQALFDDLVDAFEDMEPPEDDEPEDEPPEEEGEDEEDTEMEDGEDDEEDEDDEDEMEMEAMDERVSALEEAVDQMMAAEDVEAELSEYAEESELEEVRTELSEAVEEKEELEKRLSSLEDEPEKPRSLADTGDSDEGFEPVYDDSVGQSSGW